MRLLKKKNPKKKYSPRKKKLARPGEDGGKHLKMPKAKTYEERKKRGTFVDYGRQTNSHSASQPAD